MKRYFYTLLHLFHPADMKSSQFSQAQPFLNVQPHYNTGNVPAKENAQMNKKLVLTVLLALTILSLAACAPRATSKPLPPEEGAAYAAEVDEIVENMIVGFSENDFAKYTRDMSDQLDEDYESSIRQTADEISREFGTYQGKTLDHVEDRGRLRVVIYHLVFENEPNVTLNVFFNISDSHLIVGTNWDAKYWNSK